ncbi:P-loop NTPase fold protein, partial [Paraburkholderia bannensis]|uniref:P-loop NTPase fold protein n=1 Tax=Paraburkholderia bannensis TaxID=765414 RepID=UPI000481CA13
MSLEDTKKHLIAALQDQENRVIALSGKWGTGKSHLWRDVKEDSEDDEIGRAAYVSVFGVSDINQLQLKALRAAVPVAADNSAWAERIRRIAKAGSEVLKSINRAFGALDELALLMAPQFLRGRIVVLDDIERKHPKLSVDEILGFIDELTQQHDARFVLILNDDKLDEAANDAWATLREKVIDQEVRLITTPQESFEIARAQTKTPDGYAARTKSAVDTLGVDNIRVIRKIIRNVNRVLAGRALAPEILHRTIPSIALLSTIHYHGMDDAPDFDFVLNTGSWDDVRDEVERQKGEGKSNAIATQRAKWRELLSELGINNCDEFEELLIAFLKDGQFDASGVTKILDRYEREADQLLAKETGQALSRRLYWDADASEKQLVDDARKSIPYAKHWDAYLVTILFNELAALQGGNEVGEAFVQAWIKEFRTREKSRGNYDDDFDNLHPAIVAEIKADQAHQAHQAERATASLLEVVRRIVKQSGWGANEEFAMRKATALDFEATIRGANMEDRSFFLRHMIRMRNERRNYDSHFGNATQRFVDACRAILSAPASDRLARLIRRVVAGTP